MKTRTTISTKDHFIIIDVTDGRGNEFDSGTTLPLGIPLELIYIGFILEGSLGIFEEDKTKDSGYVRIMDLEAPLLCTSNSLSPGFKFGSLATSDKCISMSIWPKYGALGERTAAGPGYLATSDDYDKMKQNPEEGFVLEGRCEVNTVRDIENFSHVAANTYIK